ERPGRDPVSGPPPRRRRRPARSRRLPDVRTARLWRAHDRRWHGAHRDATPGRRRVAGDGPHRRRLPLHRHRARGGPRGSGLGAARHRQVRAGAGQSRRRRAHDLGGSGRRSGGHPPAEGDGELVRRARHRGDRGRDGRRARGRVRGRSRRCHRRPARDRHQPEPEPAPRARHHRRVPGAVRARRCRGPGRPDASAAGGPGRGPVPLRDAAPAAGRGGAPHGALPRSGRPDRAAPCRSRRPGRGAPRGRGRRPVAPTRRHPGDRWERHRRSPPRRRPPL
ncbi:MAG: hypothetical protein AVDCRST_MAG50-2549, partial [uncultured Acidimicrobiales bacterium]